MILRRSPLLLLVVIALTSACANRDMVLPKSQFDATYGTEVQHLPLNFGYVRMHSLLSGTHAYGKAGKSYSQGHVRVNYEDSDIVNDELVFELASALAKVPKAIDKLTSVNFDVKSIDVYLVPENDSFEYTSFSWLSPKNIEVGFGIRIYSDRDKTVQDAVRVISHELFHLAASLAGFGGPSYENERGAIATEMCTQFMIFGRVKRNFLSDPDSEYINRLMKDRASEPSISELARYGTDPGLDKIFTSGEIDERSVDSVSNLLNLCDERIKRVIKSTN